MILVSLLALLLPLTWAILFFLMGWSEMWIHAVSSGIAALAAAAVSLGGGDGFAVMGAIPLVCEIATWLVGMILLLGKKPSGWLASAAWVFLLVASNSVALIALVLLAARTP